MIELQQRLERGAEPRWESCCGGLKADHAAARLVAAHAGSDGNGRDFMVKIRHIYSELISQTLFPHGVLGPL